MADVHQNGFNVLTTLTESGGLFGFAWYSPTVQDKLIWQQTWACVYFSAIHIYTGISYQMYGICYTTTNMPMVYVLGIMEATYTDLCNRGYYSNLQNSSRANHSIMELEVRRHHCPISVEGIESQTSHPKSSFVKIYTHMSYAMVVDITYD